MTRSSGSIGGVTAAAMARLGVPVPMVESQTAANLLSWASARSKVRAGAADAARIAFIGDSKTMGAGAGSGAQGTVGAFARSRPARIAASLAASGLVMRADAWFGAAGLAAVSDVLAYDTRRSGFSGWGGGVVSLGGAALYTANTNPGSFTPSQPVNRVSLFFPQVPGAATFSVAKGAESFPVNSGGSNAFVRAEITFSTKDAAPITITRTGGGNLNITGMVAWDGAIPGVEIANMGIYGATSALQAGNSSPWSPLSALVTYAPHLTIVNLGTNDLFQNVPMTTWLGNVRAIATQARASGSVILAWPSIAGVSPSYGADAVRAQWRAALRGLAAELGCLFVDDEALLGGRAAAQANGASADGVHETAWAYDLQASAIVRAIL